MTQNFLLTGLEGQADAFGNSTPKTCASIVANTASKRHLGAIALHAMTDIKALEAAVTALPPELLVEFRRWFTEFDSARWDREIEQDVAVGKLDAFLAEAQADQLTR